MEASTERLFRRAVAGGVLVNEEWATALADPGLAPAQYGMLVLAYTKQYYVEHGRRLGAKPTVGVVFAEPEGDEPLVAVEIWEVKGRTAVLATIRRPGQVEAMIRGLEDF